MPFIDEFCPFYLSDSPTSSFEELYPFAYKAIEIFDKGANEKDLKHAIQQLRFAAPDFLFQNINYMLNEHDDDRCPRFLARILVSNAPLRVLHKDVMIRDIEAAESLEDISTEAPAVIMASSVGPELRAHYKKVMTSMGLDSHSRELESLEYTLKNSGKRYGQTGSRPAEFVRKLAEGNWPAMKFLTQIFVVRSNYLSTFLDELKKACTESYRSRRKSDGIRRYRRPKKD